MRKALKWTVWGVLGLLAGLALFVMLGLSLLRGPIERAVTEATGRELRIAKKYHRWVNLSEQHIYYMAKQVFQPAMYGDGLGVNLLSQIFDTGYQQPLEPEWDYNPSNSRIDNATAQTYTNSACWGIPKWPASAAMVSAATPACHHLGLDTVPEANSAAAAQPAIRAFALVSKPKWTRGIDSTPDQQYFRMITDTRAALVPAQATAARAQHRRTNSRVSIGDGVFTGNFERGGMVAVPFDSLKRDSVGRL